jgi:hypothetical protein
MNIIIAIFVITFMQGIHNYIPETNHLSMAYSVAAVLYLQFVLHVMLFRPWNIIRAFTLVLPRVCVLPGQLTVTQVSALFSSIRCALAIRNIEKPFTRTLYYFISATYTAVDFFNPTGS